MKNKMPRSIRKHIRIQKAHIRREFSNIEEQKEKINNLYKNFLNQNDSKRDLQPSNK